MDKLPSNITQFTYDYDNTYKIKFEQVLKQLSAHCFIYNCHKCFNPWNKCYCYCSVCKTYQNYASKYITNKCQPMKMS